MRAAHVTSDDMSTVDWLAAAMPCDYKQTVSCRRAKLIDFIV
jgi:hypothetical protein